jgi:uncharacterized protein (TIGR03086 family)
MTRPVAARWARVAGAFSATAEAVAPGQWSSPAPCAGWDARDVVAHLVEWVPGFLRAGAAIDVDPGPVADDPVEPWHQLSGAIQRVLDDPDVGTRRFEHPRAGSHALEDAISTFICSDVLVHTWDLARATGQEVVLDHDAVDAYLRQFAGADEDAMVASGHFGPRVAVPADADPQTRLIALTGRHP